MTVKNRSEVARIARMWVAGAEESQEGRWIAQAFLDSEDDRRYHADQISRLAVAIGAAGETSVDVVSKAIALAAPTEARPSIADKAEIERLRKALYAIATMPCPSHTCQDVHMGAIAQVALNIPNGALAVSNPPPAKMCMRQDCDGSKTKPDCGWPDCLLSYAPSPRGEPTLQATVICSNCGTRMPEGCGGQFRKDGHACLLNRPEPQRGQGEK